MTDFKRDYRYVTQRFFDRWNDRITRLIKSSNDRHDRRYASLKGRVKALEELLKDRLDPSSDD